MKYCFENAKQLLSGIALVAGELNIELAETTQADLTVKVTEVPGRIVKVCLAGNKAEITYGDGKARFFRGLAILADWVAQGKKSGEVTENPLFKTNGAMVDMSRNAVMNVENVKLMMRKMALMGLNTYMLYTEDTYEVEGHPYFGHMRGRYTPDEIRTLDAYAIELGIELIPCIQVLGHMATHLQWSAAAGYKDTANVMLVGAEKTYQLIHDMFRTIASCFTSRRLHMGMDETKDLGTGAYLEKNGYRPRQDIYFEHMQKVAEIARSYGFTPMMWSDMFFRLAGADLPNFHDYDVRVEFTDEVIAKIPKGVQQVFWDYYKPEEEFYAVNIEKHHKVFGDEILFAGGVWLWSGHCPLYNRSLNHTIPALDACRKKGVQEVFATVWLNGAQGSLMLGLAGLAWYADYDYKGGYDRESMKECFRISCGVPYDVVEKFELPERPDGGLLSLTTAFLHNDPLQGLVDKHIEGFETRGYYEETTRTLTEAVNQAGMFATAGNTILKLSDLLIEKADYGVRLKAAYDAGDREALAALAEECDVMTRKLQALRLAHRTSWMQEYKAFGWEVHDIRYGGLLARLDTTKATITAYLNGELARIEELEQPRLRLDGQLAENAEPRFHGRFLWMRFKNYATVNIL